MASDPRIVERLVESIAPDLYGLKVVKEAVLYSLLGGVSEESEGHWKRGNIHLLVVGDPGTGKSQLLRFAAEIAPKSAMITGNYTNTDGLTAKVIQGDNGTPQIVPGALIEADQGTLALDKIDKLSDKDMAAVQPAMAHQRITITKDGVNRTFDARVSVIASANPFLGRYNPYQTIAQNLSLSVTLLSCFDLIFIIRDIPETCKDRRIAEHILFPKRRIEPYGEIIPPSDLRTYIDYARKLKPKLSHEATQHLVNFYVEMRSASLEGGEATAISVSVRQLEALVRIAEARAKAHLRSEVQVEDTLAAINLMTRSLEQVGIDAETEELDLDILYTGRPRSLNVQLFKVMGTIEEMEKIEGLVEDAELFDTLYTKYSMTRTETARLIGKLLREGTIYSPKPGYYKRTI
jgi:replicative DNA helicase Mcm